MLRICGFQHKVEQTLTVGLLFTLLKKLGGENNPKTEIHFSKLKYALFFVHKQSCM